MKDGKVVHENELSVVVESKKMRESLYRTLYIMKHGAGVASWTMVHARPATIKKSGDTFVVSPSAWVVA